MPKNFTVYKVDRNKVTSVVNSALKFLLITFALSAISYSITLDCQQNLPNIHKMNDKDGYHKKTLLTD